MLGEGGGTGTSHTAVLPLPRLLLASICTSGRAVGSVESLLKRFVPGAAPEPFMASTTRKNPAPCPLGGVYTVRPKSSVVVGKR